MSSSSPELRDVEVNVVSSPESSRSRNASPEPPHYRFAGRGITCFPVIKTGEEEEDKVASPQEETRATATAKTPGASTNFSISSILSRTEPAAGAKKNCFGGGATGGGGLEAGVADSAMLSRSV